MCMCMYNLHVSAGSYLRQVYQHLSSTPVYEYVYVYVSVRSYRGQVYYVYVWVSIIY